MPEVAVLLDDASRWLSWLPWWVQSLALVVVCCAVVFPLHRLAFRAMKRAVESRGLFWRSLVSRTQGPSRLALLVVALTSASTTAP